MTVNLSVLGFYNDVVRLPRYTDVKVSSRGVRLFWNKGSLDGYFVFEGHLGVIRDMSRTLKGPSPNRRRTKDSTQGYLI